MALNEALSAATDAGTAVVTCNGPTVFVVTPGGLKQGEYVRILGEDPAGTYTDELFRFSHISGPSVVIQTYRDVQVNKTATSASVGVGTSGTVAA